MSLTIPLMTLRASGVLALILGIVLWTGNDNLTAVHIVLGFLVVASLWWIAAAAFTSPAVTPALAGVAVLVGLLQIVLGYTQVNLFLSAHAVVQVTHLVLGLAALGLGEVLVARMKRGQRI